MNLNCDLSGSEALYVPINEVDTAVVAVFQFRNI
jgi:hypothetical protein